MKQTTLDGSIYQVYTARKVLNVYKHADSWFWNKYSAHPYVGCEHACEYCYARSRKYIGPELSTTIRIKSNAAELLKKELQKVKKDVINTGDYQPAEKKFQLSRKMLEVVRDCGFPVILLEKSDLITQDIDLLKEINERSWCCASFSFSGLNKDVIPLFEPGAPSPERRLDAMKTVAEAGILTGASYMPILPFITDGDPDFENVIREVKTHKGTFVLVGGLTLDDNVRTRYFDVLKRKFPHLLQPYEDLYSNPHEYFGKISKKVIEICKRYGLNVRIPRYCQNFNQRVAEKLFEKTYFLELENPLKAWPYRKVAWMIDDSEKDIREIEELTALPAVGEKMAAILHEIIRGIRC